MQQKGVAVILGTIAGVRHQKKIGFCIHDRFKRGESARAEAETAGRVV